MSDNQPFGQPIQHSAPVKGLRWIIVLDHIGGVLFVLGLFRGLTNKFPDGSVAIAFLAAGALAFFLDAFLLKRIREGVAAPKALGWTSVVLSAAACMYLLRNVAVNLSGEFAPVDGATPASAGSFLSDVFFFSVTVLPLVMSAYKIASVLVRDREAAKEFDWSSDAGMVVGSASSLSIAARNAVPKLKDRSASALFQSIAAKADDIARFIRNHVELATSVRALGTYYLPTATQLIGSYMEMQEYGSANARAAENGILETLLVFDGELEKVLDDLIEHQGCDIDGRMRAMRLRLELDGR